MSLKNLITASAFTATTIVGNAQTNQHAESPQINSTHTIELPASPKKAEAENAVKFQLYQGIGKGTSGKAFNATRFQGTGDFLKGGKLQTNLFAYLDLDGNPLKTKGFGQVYLTKNMHKGLGLDAVYTFNGYDNDKNKIKYGLSFSGGLKEGFYKITVYPLGSNDEKPFEVYISMGKKISKNAGMTSFISIEGLKKAFYGETEFVHDFGKNIAAFAQARYGGSFGKPFVQGVTGVRLNIR